MRRLLIVDLEATCWERAEHAPEKMETIEIGALLVDPLEPDRPDEFQTLIRPVRHPQLSAFCTQLTGITQADVDGAEGFERAFGRFVEWLGDPLAARLGSWGSFDRRQLEQDCAAHGVPMPFAADHLNLKHLCSQDLDLKPSGMARALAAAGLALEGTHHRGLDDARNIWRLLQHLRGGRLAQLVEP